MLIVSEKIVFLCERSMKRMTAPTIAASTDKTAFRYDETSTKNATRQASGVFARRVR